MTMLALVGRGVPVSCVCAWLSLLSLSTLGCCAWCPGMLQATLLLSLLGMEDSLFFLSSHASEFGLSYSPADMS